MNSALEITKENLSIGVGLLGFLRNNLDQLTKEIGHYPVMLRCGYFKTIFTCKEDILGLISTLDERVKCF